MRVAITAAFTAALCVACLIPLGAGATVIYDQTVDLTFDARPSDFDDAQYGANDFQLSPGANTINSINWWGLYAFGNTPTKPDNFTVQFYADDGGLPAPDALYEFGVGRVHRVDTGTDIGDFDVYFYSVGISPLQLNANTSYWLSVLNDTTADVDDTWYWSFEDGGSSARGFFFEDPTWLQNDAEFGFQLSNDVVTAVPEPASVALFAAGLAGLGLMSRRRKMT